MKIDSINSRFILPQNREKKGSVNFKASPYVVSKMNPIIAEAKNLAKYKDVHLDKNLIESFVRCFVNDIKIVIKKDDSKDTNYACLEQEMSSDIFQENPVIVNTNLIIPTEMIKQDVSHSRKIHSIATIIHELTHYFDDSLANSESSLKYYHQYLRTRSNEDPNLLNVFHFIFNWLETCCQSILYKFIKFSDWEPKQVPLDKNLIDNIFVAETQMNLEDYIDSKLASSLDALGSSGKKYTYEMISRRAEMEFDAYKFQIEFQKEMLDIDGFTDVEYRTEFYQKIKSIFDSKLKKLENKRR